MFHLKQIIPGAVCLKCQGCCRFAEKDSIWSPTLLGEEISELLDNGVPETVICGGKKISLQPCEGKGSFRCSFFVMQDNLCRIYPFRPFECQLYPFLIHRDRHRVFLAVDLNCPFAGGNLKSRVLQDHVVYLKGFLGQQEIGAIIRNNPQVVQAYPQAVNLIELNL